MVNLSTKGGIAGVEVEYTVIKDCCEEYDMNVVETFAIVKRIVKRVYGKE